MERRSFMSFLGAASASMAASGGSTPHDKRTRFYMLEFFNLRNGTQPARLHDYLRNAAIPAMRRAHAGPILAMEALVAPHMPQVAVIIGCPSFEELWNVNTRVAADPDFKVQMAAWEGGDEAAFETQNTMVLQAAQYSPELVLDTMPRTTPRVFELRVYHSPTSRQLTALHERFVGSELQIFHRSGIHPVLYSSTVIGPNIPNLTYVIPFDSLDAREKAWAKFGADEEWIKVRKESIDKYGQISSVMQISLYKATPYSPVG
jgi:hypothetical protein